MAATMSATKKPAPTKKKAVATLAKKSAAPAKKAKKAAPSKKPPRALAKLYEGLHTKVFETVFDGDKALIKAFLAWGKATHPRWYAEIGGDKTPAETRAVILETLLVDEVDEVAPVAFFAGLPEAKRRAAVAAMKAAGEDEEDDDDDEQASTPGAVTIAGVTWRPGDTTLNLHVRRLTQVPDTVGQCTSLTKLMLGGNRLTSLPAAIGNLTELESLGLHSNPLTHLPPEISRCTKLKTLVLFECTELVLPALPAIETVNAQTTSVALVRSLGLSPSLTLVSAKSCGLTAVPDELRALKQLVTLDLSENRLTSLPRWLAELPLTTVNVVSNPLPAAELAWLASILRT